MVEARKPIAVAEAPPRFELGVEVLQTSALPLGYGAGRTDKLAWALDPRKTATPDPHHPTGPTATTTVSYPGSFAPLSFGRAA